MNGNPYTPGTPEYLAYQRADVASDYGYNMSPRIAGLYTDPADVMAPGAIGSPSMYPNPGGIDFGRDLPMVPGAPVNAPAGAQFGYASLGAPTMGVTPEVTGVVGPTRADIPGEYETLQGIQDIPLAEEADIPLGFGESEIGAAVTETPAAEAAAAATKETPAQRMQRRGAAATGIGQLAGGIMNITQGVRALKDVDIAGAEKGVDDAYATRPGLSTPAEFYDMQKEAYDQRLLAMRTEDINRGLATNVAAAQQFGARGLGTNLAAAAQAQRAQQQEVLQQQRLQTQALGSLAQAREREIQRREQRATFDIGIAYDELKAEQAREAYARQQISQGIVGATTGLARTALMFGAQQGAKVTPGEFSHDTNPIDIVQDGAKIGEMTGGEYIFNPTQAKKMMKEANSGNSELHKFVRKTLNRFHKDAAKHEGK